MPNSKKIKYIGQKFALELETCMQANKLDGWPSKSFLTLLICLQCSDKIFGRSRDVLYHPGRKAELSRAIFLRYLL